MRKILTISYVLGFELFWGGNIVGWMNKSLGGLGKNNRDILKQKNKKERRVLGSYRSYRKDERKKKENEGRYEHFFFHWLLSFRIVACFIVLFFIVTFVYCYFVNQFDMRKSGTLV